MGKLILSDIVLNRETFLLDIPYLSIESGKVLGVSGKSGSGKSTLLSVIAGFTSADQGKILMNGNDLTPLPPEQRKIAIVFQRPALFSHLTVMENVCFGLKIQKMSREEQEQLANLWLEKLGISYLSHRYPAHLSGGESQRVALARAVIVQFPVLLLDEPFSALDPTFRSQAREAVKAVVQELNLATLLVSHDPTDLEWLADEICEMREGKLFPQEKKRTSF